MPIFPETNATLLDHLCASRYTALPRNISWKKFLELYALPIRVISEKCYRRYTGDAKPTNDFLHEIISLVVVDFFTKSRQRYDFSKSTKFRTFLFTIIKARTVDWLRKERPFQFVDDSKLKDWEASPGKDEEDAWNKSRLNWLIEKLHNTVPPRNFEIFERIKLKGQKPEIVAEKFGIKRGLVDNIVSKVLKKLREIADSSEYKEASEDF
jgi:RNA polymerase sigma factor (sigma-70 family)